MTTTEKVLKVGGKVRWRVDEECKYRCPECGVNFHMQPYALVQQGMIIEITPNSIIGCQFKDSDRGCGADGSTSDHQIFVAFPNDHEGDSLGGWFTADELELLI